MQLDLKTLNVILANLEYPDQTLLRFVEEQALNTPIKDNSYGDGIMGESDVTAKIYEIIAQPGIFVKITYSTDSYGDNSMPTGVQFVQPAKQLVTVYESI